MRKNLLLLCFCFILLSGAFAQKSSDIVLAKTTLIEQVEELGLNRDEIPNYLVSDHYMSDYSKATHLYLWQTYQGVPVYNGLFTIGIKNDKIYNLQTSAVKNLQDLIVTDQHSLSPEQAIKSAAEQLGYPNNEPFTRIDSDRANSYVYAPTSFASNNIPVYLCYDRAEDGTYVKSWNVDLDIPGSDYMSVRVDANTGEIVSKNNYTVYCAFDMDVSHSHTASCRSAFAKDDHTATNKTNEALVTSMVVDGSSYRVYDFPAESPNHGPHEIVTDPADVLASPFGWHDVDGVEGADFTITRGNNVHAYLDKNVDNISDGSEPDGGEDLIFDEVHDQALEPADSEKAAQINLFFTNNRLHDFTYRYGFDEAAGNFQQNNYGNGGQGGDYVFAESADGSGTNNANFATPPDGESGRMQMFLWGASEFDLLTVNDPEQLAGKYDVRSAQFGGPVTDTPITGNLVLVDDGTPEGTTGCNELINGEAIAGNIAVIDRGLCDFSLKTFNAQEQGAIAVIVCNIVGVNGGDGDSDIFNMGGGENAELVTIPAIMAKYSDCQNLRASISTGIDVNATIQLPQVVGPMNLDASYDNGIIGHELGHGISNRLTGGPAQAGCLGNDEQMGEGWSDYFGLVTTVEPGDMGTDSRGIGTYAISEPITGGGIRDFPYSTDMSISPKTYDDIIGTAAPHPLGEVWAVTTWDLYWAMVDLYGYDPDINNLESGNARAIRLVMEGMKEQACQPGFASGRQGILAADIANYDGQHQCLIWEVFARRGIGFDAEQGLTTNRNDNKEGFDLPTACLDELRIRKTADDIVTPGEEFSITLTALNYLQLPDGEVATGVVITDEIPAGSSYVDGSANITPTVSGDMLVWEIGDMAYEEEVSITYSLLSDVGAQSVTQIIDDMEDGDDNWDININEGTSAFWELTDIAAASGEDAWFIPSPGDEETDNELFYKDYFTLQGDRPTLKFNHRYNTEAGSDGGFVAVQEVGQTTWTRLNLDASIRNGFTGILAYGTFAIPSLASFSGNSDDQFLDTYLDLSDYAGKDIRVQFRFGTDDNTTAEGDFVGWAIDDFEIFDLRDYAGTACITDESGFNSCDGAITLVESNGITSLEQLERDDFGMSLFPNPAIDAVNIRLTATQTEAATLSIVSVDGALVSVQNVNVTQGSDVIQLSVADIPAGMYFVQLRSNSNTSIKRLVIE